VYTFGQFESRNVDIRIEGYAHYRSRCSRRDSAIRRGTSASV
jgi:hypothetical protein